MADRFLSPTTPRANDSVPTNSRENIRFRPKEWLRRWAAGGNGAAVLASGGLWLAYGDRGADERTALEIELTRLRGDRLLKSYMRRTGQLSVGPAMA